jgi:hypothetical protein
LDFGLFMTAPLTPTLSPRKRGERGRRRNFSGQEYFFYIFAPWRLCERFTPRRQGAKNKIG